MTTEPPDPTVAAIMRCYLSQTRISWPYLVLLFGAMAVVVGALFAPV